MTFEPFMNMSEAGHDCKVPENHLYSWADRLALLLTEDVFYSFSLNLAWGDVSSLND